MTTSDESDNPVMLHKGRVFRRTGQRDSLRKALKKAKARLERSLAIFKSEGRHARPGDLDRWAKLRADVAKFEKLVEQAEAGLKTPLSPRTGERTGLLPDRIGEPDLADKLAALADKPNKPNKPNKPDGGDDGRD